MGGAAARRCGGALLLVPPKPRRHDPYAGHEIDAIGAYSADLDSCYVLPFSWIDGRRQVQLRTAPARNNQRSGISWASEFEIEALDWTSYFAGP